MPIFSYLAKDSQGKNRRGQVEAKTALEVVKLLREHKLLPVAIKEKKSFFSLGGLFSRGRVRETELIVFTRSLAALLKAGLSLPEALDNLKEIATGMKLREIIEDLIHQVGGGTSLSKSLVKYRGVFNHLYISIVSAGEHSGNLDTVLAELAEALERDYKFKSEVRGAFIYPAIVVLLMVVVGIFMLVTVIPQLATLYGEFNVELPLLTRFFVALAEAMRLFWWFFLLLSAGLLMGFYYLQSKEEGRYYLSKLYFKLPIFGRINQFLTVSLFSRTLSLLVKSGVPILESLKLVTKVVGNNDYQHSLRQIITDIQHGFPLSNALKTGGVFPPLVWQLVRIGEESGSIDKNLLEAAEFFENDARRLTKGITSSLEPILLIVLGLGVAFIAVAVFMPMYNLVYVIR